MIRVRWIAISFVMRQRCFPHIGMFSFLHRECINLHEGRLLRNKMHLHSTLKGCFLVLTNFDQSQELKTTAKKSLQFFAFQHVRCRCCYRSYLDRFLNTSLGKLPTYPSPKPTLTPTSHLGQNVGLGEG